MASALQLQLKDLLISNADEVLQKLKQVYAHNNENYNFVIELMSRLNEWRKDQAKGAMSQADENQRMGKIQDGIFYLIDNISEEEAAAYELENAIFKRILVVCKSADREQYMRDLFPDQVFKGVEFDVSEQPRPASSVNRFDLVVFDNTPHGLADDPNTLLKYYLDHTSPYVLYFGKNLNLLYDYPEKAYFANSIFSLHARIEEMMTYLKYKKNGF